MLENWGNVPVGYIYFTDKSEISYCKTGQDLIKIAEE